MYLQFIWLFIAAILAFIGSFFTVIPAIASWVKGDRADAVEGAAESFMAKFKARFAGEATA